MSRRVLVLGLPALLVAQTLFQLAPTVVASDVSVVVGPVSVSLNTATTAGLYAGFVGNAADPNPQNLTTTGATDWRIWGESTTSLAGDDRKAGGTGISDLINLNPTPSISLRALGPLGLGVGTGPSTMPFSFGWTDGSVLGTVAVAKGGLQHDNTTNSVAPGYGFSFSVPAVAGTSHLKVWVSAHHATGLLTATLTGVTPVPNNSVSGGQNHGGVYTIDFTGDGSPGQTLTVRYELQSALDPNTVDPDGGGNNTEANVVVYAAALTAPAAPAPDFAIGAAPGALTVVQGTNGQSTISTTQAHGPGTVSLAAAVTGPGSDVTATLTSSSIAAGASTTLTVAAGATATPGAYTVTVTGTEGSKIHDAVVDVTVVPSTGAPVLFEAVPTDTTHLKLNGLIHGTPGHIYTVRVWASPTCTNGVLDTPTPVATTTFDATNSAGDVYLNGTVVLSAPVPLGSFVAGQITGQITGDAYSPIGPCTVVSPDNDQWPRALDISNPSGTMSSSGYIDTAGRGRWYRFTVTPGSRLNITLSNLPADYDLFLFKDIGQAYSTLTDPSSLTKLSAEFAPSAFSPSAFSPSAFSPSAFSPSAFSPSAFSPSAFSPSAFSPSAFSPSAFSPSAFSPSAFSPSAFSPSAFSPSAFSPSAFSPSAFSGAQTRSLIGISAAAGTGAETLVGDTWTNTGNFYILVGGKNGASSLTQPFSLSVTVTDTTCTAMPGSIPAAFSGAVPTGLTSLIIEDTSRQPGSTDDIAALQTKLTTFKNRAEVNGAVVDLGNSAVFGQIHALNSLADTNYDCVYKKNLVADAIKGVINRYRAANPNLKYIVILGGDEVIPFYRYPDQALLGPESDYVPPVSPITASETSLRANYVLGQDAYGASTSISVGAISFPVPDLPVGRLVETAHEESGMLDAYLTTTAGVTATPTSSLVTGYDFLADAATSVQGDLNAGTGRTGDSLISPNNIAPTAGWNATQLKTALLGSRHDLIFLAGHFSANNALAADFSTTINSTDLASSNVDLTNSIVFSAGCHSGYNLVDKDALTGITQPLDWVQTFARKGATLIAGTGYQYGDTDFLEYSERIYAEFAHQLRIGPNADGSGPVSVGQALMRSKQIYLARTPDVRGLHQKALLEATLFGLPMLSVNMPTGRIPATTGPSIVTSTTAVSPSPDPRSVLGLRSADMTVDPSTSAHDVTLATLDASGIPIPNGSLTATYYSGRDGVVTNPGEPALPLQSENVSAPSPGGVLRGVGFRSGTFQDSSVIPLTGAPNTEIRGVHTTFSSTAFFPMRPWTINYYDALGSPTGATRLLITPAQHKVAAIGDTRSTLRLYSKLGLKLFYSNYTGDSALAAAPAITGVTSSAVGGVVSFSAHVVGDPAAGIQQVWITYTGTGGATDTWASVDLHQDATDSTLWTGTEPVDPAKVPSVRFMVQAVNGVGLVSMDDNLGSDYSVAGAVTTAPVSTSLTLSGPASGAYGTSASVSATLKDGSGALVSGKPIVFTIGGTTRVATIIAGVATASMPLTSVPGPYQLTAAFLGDPSTSPSSKSQAFSIAKLGTSVVLSPSSATVTLGADSGIVATLIDGNHAALPYRTIFFVLSGPVNRTTTATTDFAGRASFGALPATVGSYSLTACFNGPASPSTCSTLAIPDSTYSPSGTTASVTVAWPFNGFYSPISNQPTVNVAKGGSSIPIKFSLGGDRGSLILNGPPTVKKYACMTGVATDLVDEVATPGSSGLQYDAATGIYTYVWKTEKSFTGSCYYLTVRLADTTSHTANFQFK